MKTINYRMLKGKNACSEHLTLFRATFGVGEVELSKENLKVAVDVNLDISFLTRFLSVEDLVEYDRVSNATYDEYKRVGDEAWAEYERVRGVAWAEYARVCDEAWAEYNRVCDKARTKYNRVRGEALIEILTRD